MKSKVKEDTLRYRALMDLLRTAETIWNASRVFFARWEISPSQFNVLNLLRLNPAGLSQTDLSRELIMHRSNVTGLVDRLEKRGFVERKEVAQDRRAYRVVLTLSGSQLLSEILTPYFAGSEQVWDGFADRRVTELTNDLQKVAANAERISAGLKS